MKLILRLKQIVWWSLKPLLAYSGKVHWSDHFNEQNQLPSHHLEAGFSVGGLARQLLLLLGGNVLEAYSRTVQAYVLEAIFGWE